MTGTKLVSSSPVSWSHLPAERSSESLRIVLFPHPADGVGQEVLKAWDLDVGIHPIFWKDTTGIDHVRRPFTRAFQ